MVIPAKERTTLGRPDRRGYRLFARRVGLPHSPAPLGYGHVELRLMSPAEVKGCSGMRVQVGLILGFVACRCTPALAQDPRVHIPQHSDSSDIAHDTNSARAALSGPLTVERGFVPVLLGGADDVASEGVARWIDPSGAIVVWRFR